MTLTSIIILILLGLFLLLLEILFVPGMILGIVAVLMMAVGVIFAYKDFGTTVGTITLISSSSATALSVWWAFKTNVWRKIGVKSTIGGKADKFSGLNIQAGQKGVTNSRLNPVGKAVIEGKLIEVQSREGFIDEEKAIVVTEVRQNKIFVKAC